MPSSSTNAVFNYTFQKSVTNQKKIYIHIGVINSSTCPAHKNKPQNICIYDDQFKISSRHFHKLIIRTASKLFPNRSNDDFPRKKMTARTTDLITSLHHRKSSYGEKKGHTDDQKEGNGANLVVYLVTLHHVEYSNFNGRHAPVRLPFITPKSGNNRPAKHQFFHQRYG